MGKQLVKAPPRNEHGTSELAVLGQVLKEQREAVDMTLEALYVHTRINPKFLRAMEVGDFHDMPEAYRRLYLKKYALTVRLDPDGVLAHFDSIVNAPEPGDDDAVEGEEVKPKRSKKRLLLFALPILFVAGWGAIQVWLLPEQNPEAPIAELEAEPPGPPPEPSYKTQVVQAYSSPTEFSLAEPTPSLVLSGKALEATWVWVWADGKQIFKGFAQLGDEWVWQADRQLRIEIEHPAAFTLVLGDTPLVLEAAPDHQLRLYLSRFSIWTEELAIVAPEMDATQSP